MVQKKGGIAGSREDACSERELQNEYIFRLDIVILSDQFFVARYQARVYPGCKCVHLAPIFEALTLSIRDTGRARYLRKGFFFFFVSLNSIPQYMCRYAVPCAQISAFARVAWLIFMHGSSYGVESTYVRFVPVGQCHAVALVFKDKMIGQL